MTVVPMCGFKARRSRPERNTAIGTHLAAAWDFSTSLLMARTAVWLLRRTAAARAWR